jgi:hypothetical protein
MKNSINKTQIQVIKDVMVEYGDISYDLDEYGDREGHVVKPLNRLMTFTFSSSSSILKELYCKLSNVGYKDTTGESNEYHDSMIFENGNIILTKLVDYNFEYAYLNVSENKLCDENIKLNIEYSIELGIDFLSQFMDAVTYEGNKYNKELIIKMLDQQPDDGGYVPLLCDFEGQIVKGLRVKANEYNLAK